MAIMAVKVENTETLKMNEFFDYNGRCWAISRSRTQGKPVAAELEDFYECTIFTEQLEDVPVVFLAEKSAAAPEGASGGASIGASKSMKAVAPEGALSGASKGMKAAAPEGASGGASIGASKGMKAAAPEGASGGALSGASKGMKAATPEGALSGAAKSDAGALYICGWYKKAEIHRKVIHPTWFLEGNISARSLDAVLLPEKSWLDAGQWFLRTDMVFGEKMYRVIEEDDACYEKLAELLRTDGTGEFPVRYELFTVRKENPKQKNRQAAYEFCIDRCAQLALQLMQDQCEDIGEIKTLREYAQMAINYNGKSPDGYYYKAMAEEQAGFVKNGLKSVNRALALEPDGADIMALKANLLTALGKYKEAAELYKESFDISGDESYLLMQGRIFFLMGDVDGAYKVYRKITDKELLENAGINLKDMEKRWPFVAIRGLKNLLKRGN